MKTVLILSALYRKALNVTNNRAQSHRTGARSDPSRERHPMSVLG